MEFAPLHPSADETHARLLDERAIDVALGQRIRQLRRARNMTQADLARIIGVTYQQVYKYEYGIDRLAIGRLVSIAVALSVSVGELLEALSGLLDSEAPAASGMVDAVDRMLLLEAYGDIKDDDVRSRVRELIYSLSGAGRPAGRRHPQRRAGTRATVD